MSKTRFASSLIQVAMSGSALAVLMAVVSGCASTPRDAAMTDANRVATAQAKPLTGCVNDTGSRIQRKPEDCRGPGRTYSDEDLERTGQFNAADALRRLDPSLQ